MLLASFPHLALSSLTVPPHVLSTLTLALWSRMYKYMGNLSNLLLRNCQVAVANQVDVLLGRMRQDFEILGRKGGAIVYGIRNQVPDPFYFWV